MSCWRSSSSLLFILFNSWLSIFRRLNKILFLWNNYFKFKYIFKCLSITLLVIWLICSAHRIFPLISLPPAFSSFSGLHLQTLFMPFELVPMLKTFAFNALKFLWGKYFPLNCTWSWGVEHKKPGTHWSSIMP